MCSTTTPQKILSRGYHVCFSVGGTRGAFHAGAVHAIVMSQAPPPGLIAGSSVGAAHAAMLARLLGNEGSDRERMSALREYLHGLLHTSSFVLLGAPDLRDVFPYDDTAPPVHTGDETAEGDEVRQGLKRLTASLFKQAVSTQDLGRFAKAYVDFKDRGGFGRRARMVWTGGWMLAKMAVNLPLGRVWDHVVAYREATGDPQDRITYALLKPYGLEKGLLPFDKVRALIRQTVRRPGWDDDRTDRLALEGLAASAEVELLLCAADLHGARLVVLPPDQVRAVEGLAASMSVPVLWPPVRREELLNPERGEHPDVPEGPFVDAVRVTPFPFRQLVYRLKHLSATVARDQQSPSPVTDVTHRILMVGAFPKQAGARPDLAYDNMIDVVERSVTLQAFAEISLDLKLARVVSDTLARPEAKPAWIDHTRQVIESLPKALGGGWNPRGGVDDEGKPVEDPVDELALRLEVERVEPDHLAEFEDLTHASPTELGQLAADGCKRMLGTLARLGLINAPSEGDEVACSSLMNMQTSRRYATPELETPGVPDLCRLCDGRVRLEAPVEEPTTRVDEEPIQTWEDLGPSTGEPVVAMTLAGGVFKGVFQLGSVHALHTLRRTPRILAGASVGTLVAAQAGRIFAADSQEEGIGLLQLSSWMYFTQDQWVPSERWKSFQRDLLERVSQTRLRLSDLNALFRDYKSPLMPMRASFRTAQGLQQLTFAWPAELLRLWDAAYKEDLGDFWGQLRLQLLRTLKGYSVPLEVLGAEPIEEEGWRLGLGWNRFTCYEDMLKRGGIRLVATTTDLKAGRIRLLGMEEGLSNPRLLPAVWASSAFPGLFRPRRESELFPESGASDRLFSDGGIFNNNPLNEVARFLLQAARGPSPWIYRPKAPHLIIAAALHPPVTEDPTAGRSINAIWARTQTLSYHYKQERFSRVQAQLRALIKGLPATMEQPPIPIQVASVTPQWVVKTFGATKALGFDDRLQLQSIAHGCHQTLGSFAATEGMEAYGLEVRKREHPTEALHTCPWFSKGDGSDLSCEFAAAGRQPEGLSDESWARVQEAGRDLRRCCARPKTHQAR